MKKVLLIIVALFISSAVYSQTLLLNENFDYGATANGDILAVTTNWVRHSGSAGPNYLNTSLTFTGYPSSGVGGAINPAFGSSGNSDGDINRLLSTNVTTASNVYVSFLLNVTAAKSTADYFFHLGQAVIATTFRGKIFAKTSNTGYLLGICKASEAAVYGTTDLVFGQTYLVVLKYSYNPAAADDDLVSLSIYQNNMPTSEASTALTTIGPVGAATTGDPTDIGVVAVRQGSNTPTSTIDGIRVSTNWGLTVTGTPTSIQKEGNIIPNDFSLDQNYPNPFNPSTSISFAVSQPGNYSLKVYDILGKEVATLVNEQLSAGKYKFNFNASNLASGTYIYKLTGNNVNLSQKMLLLK